MNYMQLEDNNSPSNYSTIISAYQETQTPRIQYYNISSNQNMDDNDSQVKNELNEEIKIGNKELTKEQSILVNTKPETDEISQEYPQTRIVNVVSMFYVGCPLNLRKIALTYKNSEYNPKRINAVIMRIKKPKTVALIFYTGRIICTGAKTEEESEEAARLFAKILKKYIEPKVKFCDFKIINIVSTCDIKNQLNLTKLSAHIAYKFSSNQTNKDDKNIVSYAPEIFPGLIYRMCKPEITLLIFASGKVNFVGVKDRKDIPEALKKIYPVLLNHKIKKGNQDGTKEEKNGEEVEKDFNYM